MLNNAEYDTCKLCKYDPHSLAASIKRFLMQMPNNLLSHVPVDLLEAAAENPRLALKFGHHIPGTGTHTHTLSIFCILSTLSLFPYFSEALSIG